MLQPWLLLLLSLPPRPSSLRVRAWRRLKALGAIALKSGAYLLPFSPDRYEQFQWLAQEVQKDRGEATLLKVDRVENMKQPEVVRLFHEARNADYASLTDRYRKLGSAKPDPFRRTVLDDWRAPVIQLGFVIFSLRGAA